MKSAWSGSKNWLFFFDLDQKRGEFFLIWIKKHIKYFWSGPKKRAFFFDLDQKLKIFFLIWIKNLCFFFWSGSKNRDMIFDLDQKNAFFFDLDQKISFFFLVQDQKIFKFGSKIIKDHEIKKWSTVLIHDLPTVEILKIARSKTPNLFALRFRNQDLNTQAAV